MKFCPYGTCLHNNHSATATLCPHFQIRIIAKILDFVLKFLYASRPSDSGPNARDAFETNEPGLYLPVGPDEKQFRRFKVMPTFTSGLWEMLALENNTTTQPQSQAPSAVPPGRPRGLEQQERARGHKQTAKGSTRADGWNRSIVKILTI